MKVIKRDGHIVDYDKNKIIVAITKAKDEVSTDAKISEEGILEIVNYIESLNKKRILVEDIQDIIEHKLMEQKKYDLAKHYIVYRYNRQLVRKSNTTDQSILSLIRSDNNYSPVSKLASVQRSYIAGEVSKDLTKRILLPEKIVNAHEEGILCFHDEYYYVQPIFNSSVIDLQDMLEKGTNINGEINPPKDFIEACHITSIIISSCIANQYGALTIDIYPLAKYLKKSKDKLTKLFKNILKNELDKEILNKLVERELTHDLKTGIEILLQSLNSISFLTGRIGNVSIYMQIKNENNQEMQAMIIEEILDSRIVQNNKSLLIYVLDENNSLKGKKYDYLTMKAIKCIGRNIRFLSEKKMKEKYDGEVFPPLYDSILPLYKQDGLYKHLGRFNQGIVTINLPSVAFASNGDEEYFFKILNERMEIIKEALMCRHHSLMGTSSSVSPVHYCGGAISRMNEEEKVDSLLMNGYSVLQVGFLGLYEATKIIKKVFDKEFSIKVLDEMNKTIKSWEKELSVGFNLYPTHYKKLSEKLLERDLNNYGKIKEINDKDSYSFGYNIGSAEKISEFEKREIESSFNDYVFGVNYLNKEKNEKNEDLIKYIYDKVIYAEITEEN